MILYNSRKRLASFVHFCWHRYLYPVITLHTHFTLFFLTHEVLFLSSAEVSIFCKCLIECQEIAPAHPPAPSWSLLTHQLGPSVVALFIFSHVECVMKNHVASCNVEEKKRARERYCYKIDYLYRLTCFVEGRSCQKHLPTVKEVLKSGTYLCYYELI